MMEFYSKGYVCYFRASQMHDLVEKSANDERKLGELKRVVAAYEELNRELGNRSTFPDNGLRMRSSLFSNEMFVSYIQDSDNESYPIEEQLIFVLDEILGILSFFRKVGVTLEGGISYGEVYHSGNIIIGPAVVRAVLAMKKGQTGIVLDEGTIGFAKNNRMLESFVSGMKLKE